MEPRQGSDTRAAFDRVGEQRDIVLKEEQLKVGKRAVSAGEVQIRKTVHTEQVNIPVELKREDVVIERVSASDVRAGTAASNFQEEVIDVPLTREEAVVSKEAHVTGAVRVAKTSIAETQTVSDSVRKEDVEVIRDGKTVTERTDLKSRDRSLLRKTRKNETTRRLGVDLQSGGFFWQPFPKRRSGRQSGSSILTIAQERGCIDAWARSADRLIDRFLGCL